MNPFRRIGFIAVLVVAMNAPVSAGAAEPSGRITHGKAVSEIYAKGQRTLQIVSGVLFTPSDHDHGISSFDYAQTNIRLGYMRNSPKETPSWYRGNIEVILELSNAIVFEGPGDYLGGITGLVRYNFVQPDTRWIPYIQGGVGVVYNDVYKDKTQSAIGQAIEFTPQASVGLRYHLRNRWSVDVEAMYHHISNAGMSDRNAGINAFGGFLGISYFFDRP